MTPDFTRLIGRSEAARRLGVSAEMVSILMRQGKLAFTPTVYGRLLDPGDVEKLRYAREAKTGRGIAVL
jgi:hypothetical protein